MDNDQGLQAILSSVESAVQTHIADRHQIRQHELPFLLQQVLESQLHVSSCTSEPFFSCASTLCYTRLYIFLCIFQSRLYPLLYAGIFFFGSSKFFIESVGFFDKIIHRLVDLISLATVNLFEGFAVYSGTTVLRVYRASNKTSCSGLPFFLNFRAKFILLSSPSSDSFDQLHQLLKNHGAAYQCVLPWEGCCCSAPSLAARQNARRQVWHRW